MENTLESLYEPNVPIQDMDALIRECKFSALEIGRRVMESEGYNPDWAVPKRCTPRIVILLGRIEIWFNQHRLSCVGKVFWCAGRAIMRVGRY